MRAVMMAVLKARLLAQRALTRAERMVALQIMSKK